MIKYTFILCIGHISLQIHDFVKSNFRKWKFRSIYSDYQRLDLGGLKEDRSHIAVAEKSPLTSFLRLPPAVTLLTSSLFPSRNSHFSVISKWNKGKCLVCNIYLTIMLMPFFGNKFITMLCIILKPAFYNMKS